MSTKHRCNRDGSKNWSYPVNPLMPANVGRSRPALLGFVAYEPQLDPEPPHLVRRVDRERSARGRGID